MSTKQNKKELDITKFRYQIQCKDKNNNIGCFIIERKTGTQVTETYKDSYSLFTSQEYQKLIQ